jgi:hypothetical protein
MHPFIFELLKYLLQIVWKVHVSELSISNPLIVLSVSMYWSVKHCYVQWNPFRNTIFYIDTLLSSV